MLGRHHLRMNSWCHDPARRHIPHSRPPAQTLQRPLNKPTRRAGTYDFFFMPLMQLARNVWRGLPWRPFASACLEHSIDSALRGVSGGFTFGIVLVVVGGLAAGGGAAVV